MPSTVSSNTRATRSRLSSPQRKPNGAAEAAPASNGTEGSKKTFMQKWLEPPLQNKASFQEIGLQRHGVVENMAPLGTLPKAAMSKKLIAAAVRESSVGQDTSTPVSKKIILKRPNTTNNTPAAAVVAAPTEQEPEALTVPSKRRNYSAKVAEDDDDDGDYKPKSSGAVHQSAATPSSPSAGRIKVTRRSLAKPSPSRSAPDSLHHTTTTAADENLPRSENQENVDKVVEAAVDEALRHFRYPTAWALRTLYDENSSNPHFVSMFEQVFQQTATSETLRKFQRLLHDKKKEGKKGNKGCYYFVPPSTNSRFTPHKPRPAPYGDLVKLELPKMSASEPDAHVSKKLKTGKTRSTPASGKKAGSHGVNGSSRAHLESPLRNRGQRALSVGSDSSLSSAQSVSHPDEFGDEEMEDEEDRGRGGAVAGRPSAPGGSPSRAPAATQPIASRVRSVAAKKNGDVSPTPNPNSPSSIPDSAAPGMPALVDDPVSFPNLQPATSSRKTRRSEKASPSPAPAALKFPSRFGPPDETDLRSQYRNSSRNCSESLKNAPESFVRGGRQSHGRDSSVPAKRKAARELDEAEVATPKQQQQLSQQSRGPTTRSTRSSRKRAHDDVDDEASPTSLIFPPPPEPSSSRMNSRAGTPSNPRASKKPRTGPRVKNSPMKKKAGPSAGVPRASGERGSPVPNGPSNNQDENDDYCSSCGGNGELVCCDGCTRAFHFKCVDPPLLEGALPDEWYCNVCLVTRNPAALTQHSGCFSTLLNIIEKKNSSAFRLPADVRGYFEGVKTGTDGEYETVAPPASKTKKRGVYDDPPDFFRIRTPEGRATLCHNCSTSATDNRPIIPCSLCGLWWHIDCLDPPLANPPVLRTWVCPAHVDDLLAELPDSLAPAHKFRKIKGASVIKPAFRRGTVNNGFVEVDDDSETDAASGWKDVGSFGRLYRLPATGVKLDFISKVREKRRFRKSTKPVEPVPPRHDAVPSQPAPQQDSYLRNPQLIDQALATDNLRAATGQVDLLVEAMLSEANPSILAVMARGNALSIANDDEIATADLQSLQAARAQMEAMMARIDQRLQAANTRPAQAPVEQQEQQGGTAKKDVSTPTVTTPEPDEPVPSIKDQEAGADDIVVKTDGNSPANADIEDVAMATPAATTATEEKQDMADIDMASNPGDIPGDGETPKAKKTSTKDTEKLDAMLTPSTSPMATQADADANTDGGKIIEPAKPDVVEKSEAGADWDMRMD